MYSWSARSSSKFLHHEDNSGQQYGPPARLLTTHVWKCLLTKSCTPEYFYTAVRIWCPPRRRIWFPQVRPIFRDGGCQHWPGNSSEHKHSIHWGCGMPMRRGRGGAAAGATGLCRNTTIHWGCLGGGAAASTEGRGGRGGGAAGATGEVVQRKMIVQGKMIVLCTSSQGKMIVQNVLFDFSPCFMCRGYNTNHVNKTTARHSGRISNKSPGVLEVKYSVFK